jgi:hypothetical protein
LEAVRAAEPARLSGFAAQQAAIKTVAAWENKHTLAPLNAAAVTAAAGSMWPAQTAGALMVAAGGQAVAARLDKGKWTRRERTAAATWAMGAAGWAGMHLVLPDGSWWQWALGLAAATGAQSVRWWTAPQPAPAEPEPAPIYVQAVSAVLGEITAEGGPMVGAQLGRVVMPADQVVVADLTLGYGLHARAVPLNPLRNTIEARLGTHEDGVEVKVTGVNTLRVTASWSTALDDSPVLWRPDMAPEEGQVWVGIGDDRADILIPAYEIGEADKKISVYHGWLIGTTGSGKSTTATDLLLPGMASGCELVFVADGKGDSVDKLRPYVARYAAHSPQRFEQVITLVAAIMASRQRRGWKGPSPTDPLITLFIDEATSVKMKIDKKTQELVYEIGRMGRSLGVRTIQGTQTPLVEDLIGESGWRAQVRWIIGHRVMDSGHGSIAAQSTSEEVSLLGLPDGRAVVLNRGKVIARRAKVAYVSDADVAAAMDGVAMPTLHPDDAAFVKPLWDLTEGWDTPEAITAGSSRSGTADLRLHRWTTTYTDPTAAGPDGASGPTSAAARSLDGDFGTDDFSIGDDPSPRPSPHSSSDPGSPGTSSTVGTGAVTARDFILDRLTTVGPCTANDIVKAGKWSRSRVFEVLDSLVVLGLLAKNGAVYSLTEPDFEQRPDSEPDSEPGGFDDAEAAAWLAAADPAPLPSPRNAP